MEKRYEILRRRSQLPTDHVKILNVVESNQILPVRDWYELITAPPADRVGTWECLVSSVLTDDC